MKSGRPCYELPVSVTLHLMNGARVARLIANQLSVIGDGTKVPKQHSIPID